MKLDISEEIEGGVTEAPENDTGKDVSIVAYSTATTLQLGSVWQYVKKTIIIVLFQIS